jgi:Uma2 family endonuclease
VYNTDDAKRDDGSEVIMTDVQQVAAPPALDKGVSVAEWQQAYEQSEAGVEIVEGEIIEMSPATRQHNLANRTLFRELDTYVAKHDLGEVFFETPYVLDGQKRHHWVKGSRVPDVSFVTRQRIDEHDQEHGDEDGPWWLAPDLAVEIVSQNDKYTDVQNKIEEYLRFGVRAVWIIDPQRRAISQHTAEQPGGSIYHEDATLPGEPILPGWSIAVADVFPTPPAQPAEEEATESGETD